MAFPLDNLLRQSVNPGLRQLGFRRTGRTYRLGAKCENQCTISIQASTDAGTPGRIFYVWVSVIPFAYVAYSTRNSESGVPDDPPYDRALLSRRLKAPREVSQVRTDNSGREIVEPTRWYYDDEIQSMRCGSLLVETVAGLLPMLERLRTPDAIIDHYDLPVELQGPLPKNGPMAPMTQAVILSDLGPSPRLESLISEVRADGYDEIADWVEARASARENAAG